MAICLLGACLFVFPPLSSAQEDVRTALARHRYGDALKISEGEISRHPTDPRPWLAKALSQDGLGHIQESFVSLDFALKLDPAYLAAAKAGAQIAYRSRDARAARYLALILKHEANNPTANAMAGVLAFEKGDCPAALDYFRRAGHLIESDPKAEMQFAVCLGRSGDSAAAVPHFERLHEHNPADLATSYDLASVYVEKRRFRDAIHVLEQARTAGTHLDPDTMNLLGNAYAGNDQIMEAIDTYRKAITLDPHDERQYIDLAILSMDHQSPEVALSVLDAGILNNPKSGALHTMRGSVYTQVAKNDKAQADFEAADRLTPSQTFGTIGLGLMLRDDGNLEAAQAILIKKLRDQPGDPVLNYMLADILMRKGAAPGQADFIEAQRLLTASIARKPDFAQAHAELGKLHMKAGQLLPAIIQLEAAVKLEPTDRTALNQLVAAYRRSGRMEDATRIAAQLAQAVGEERARESEKNRVHLILDSPATAPAALSQ